MLSECRPRWRLKHLAVFGALVLTPILGCTDSNDRHREPGDFDSGDELLPGKPSQASERVEPIRVTAVNDCGGYDELLPILGLSCGDGSIYICDGHNSITCENIISTVDVIIAPTDGVDTEDTVDDQKILAHFKATLELTSNALEVVDYGFCWGLESIPSIENSLCKLLGPVDIVDVFGYSTTDFLPGHAYYLRPVVIVKQRSNTNITTLYGEETVFITPPKDVVVSTESLELYSDKLQLAWEAVEGAIEYIIHRDGNEIARVTTNTFADFEAEPGSVPGVVPSISTSNSPNRVILEWDDAEVENGPVHRYQIQAVFPESTSELSDTLEGYRLAAPIIDYELSIDDGQYISLGLVNSYSDGDAPAAILSPPTITTTQGISTTHVGLRAADFPEVTRTQVNYKLRAVNAVGAGTESEGFYDSRDAGEYLYQWERAEADDDLLYEPIENATTPNFDDFTAPDNGAPLYYRLRVQAQGTQQVYSESKIGYRAVLADVHTASVENIGSHEATLRGRLLSLGIPRVTEYGFCYGTMSVPARGGKAICISLGVPSESDIGHFYYDVRGLKEATRYFVRSYALSEIGTSYGSPLTFWTTTEEPKGYTTNLSSGVDHGFDNDVDKAHKPSTHDRKLTERYGSKSSTH